MKEDQNRNIDGSRMPTDHAGFQLPVPKTTLTLGEQQQVRQILAYVAGFAAHKSGCASHVEQTSEFCTCGCIDANKLYQKAMKLLEVK